MACADRRPDLGRCDPRPAGALRLEEAALPHVHVLENQALILERVRFLVTTGWTDYTSTGDVEAATRTAWE
ncbi:hypothetical protein D3C85_648690 [compost metagenome]|jgi:hypothetical protein